MDDYVADPVVALEADTGDILLGGSAMRDAVRKE